MRQWELLWTLITNVDLQEVQRRVDETRLADGAVIEIRRWRAMKETAILLLKLIDAAFGRQLSLQAEPAYFDHAAHL